MNLHLSLTGGLPVSKAICASAPFLQLEGIGVIPLTGFLLPQYEDRRGARRRELRLVRAGHIPERSVMVTIHDLSRTGLLIDTAAGLAANDIFGLKLPDGSSRDVRVAWQQGTRFGCEFVIPLTSADLSAVLWQTLLADPPAEGGVIEEVVVGIDPTLEALRAWQDGFDRDRASAGHRLIGFRRDADGRIIAIVSKTQ